MDHTHLVALLPFADIAPDRNEGSTALVVILLLVAAVAVIGVVIAVLRSRRK